MRLLLAHTHNLVEDAGAASLAGAIKTKDRLAGKNVVMILSGMLRWECAERSLVIRTKK